MQHNFNPGDKCAAVVFNGGERTFFTVSRKTEKSIWVQHTYDKAPQRKKLFIDAMGEFFMDGNYAVYAPEAVK